MEVPTDRYSRHTLFYPIGKAGQQKLSESSVLIVGLGALGTVLANNLARAGVGRLKLVDRDFVEESNLQRQVLYDERDAAAALPKAVAAEKKIKEINSFIQCEAIVQDVNFTNIEELMSDVDLVLDGADNLEVRYLINDACVKTGIPWVYGACVSSYGMFMPVIPGETPCIHCVFPAPPHAGETCDTAGVINPISNIIASMETAEALKLLVGDLEAISRKLITIDVWENRFISVPVVQNENCPVCVQKIFKYLDGQAGLRTTTLCGRNAVQVVPGQPLKLNFSSLMEKLRLLGKVNSNGFLVTFKTEGYEMVVFGDARAIVKGTQDESVARTLYSRYIGA